MDLSGTRCGEIESLLKECVRWMLGNGSFKLSSFILAFSGLFSGEGKSLGVFLNCFAGKAFFFDGHDYFQMIKTDVNCKIDSNNR